MNTTWWKRCFEGLRGARLFHLVSRYFANFHWSWCGVWLCFVVCVGCFVCLFVVFSENSAFN